MLHFQYSGNVSLSINVANLATNVNVTFYTTVPCRVHATHAITTNKRLFPKFDFIPALYVSQSVRPSALNPSKSSRLSAPPPSPTLGEEKRERQAKVLSSPAKTFSEVEIEDKVRFHSFTSFRLSDAAFGQRTVASAAPTNSRGQE